MTELCKFKVGKNKIIVSKSWWWGTINVEVNGRKLERKITWVGGKKEYNYEFGKHKLKININIPGLLPAFSEWKYKIYVDGEKIKSFKKV